MSTFTCDSVRRTLTSSTSSYKIAWPIGESSSHPIMLGSAQRNLISNLTIVILLFIHASSKWLFFQFGRRSLNSIPGDLSHAQVIKAVNVSVIFCYTAVYICSNAEIRNRYKVYGRLFLSVFELQLMLGLYTYLISRQYLKPLEYW